MSNSNDSATERSAWLIDKPWLAAILSLVVPGLGQLLTGSVWRGVTIFASIVGSVAIIQWQELPTLYIFITFVYLWNIWDAYSLSQQKTRSFLPPLLAILVVVYAAGWVITEIEPAKLFRQANRVKPIMEGFLNPDFIERESESRNDRAPFEVPCSDNPPPLVTTLPDGATIAFSKSCGEIGDNVFVEGGGLLA